MSMGQRTEKEESDLKTLSLCVNNCAVSATNNMCLNSSRRSDYAVRSTSVKDRTAPMSRRGINRCSGCSRKVGLTGFRCRCGDLFCSEHRYSDRHVCSFDYKTAGREAIARENPVVKAAKIIKV